MIPHAANWYAGEDPWSTIYGLPLRLADERAPVRRVADVVQRARLGLTLPWLASLDRAAVEAHALGWPVVCALNFNCRRRTRLSCRSRPQPPRSSERPGIRASIRAGAVRVGFHLYNTEDDLDRLLDALWG